MGNIRAKIKIGDLVEALGAKAEKQEVNINNYNIKVNTPYGFKKIDGAMKTEELSIVNVKTNSYSLNCATRHRIETKNGFDFATNAKEVKTKNGFEDCKITDLNKKENCYDIQVSDVHSYWSNNMHSHNSIFLANWAVNAMKQGYNVLVYTLEIAEERLSMRHDAILTKIPVDELAIDIDKLKKKYQMFAKTSKANLWIKEFATKTASVNQLKAHHEQLMVYENFKPDLIIVDYAGLMKPTYKTGEGYEDLKTIYEDLRGWAGEADLPILTAAQTNRKSLGDKGGTKELITQAQVSESLGITQTLDVFMTITQSLEEKEDQIISLYFDKHRNGESSKMMKFNINYKNFLLEELDI
jgi:replicative DNA helicase